MTREEAVAFAKKAGHPQPNMDGLFHLRFADLVAAAEQKRCIGIVYGQCGSDNVAQRTVDAIRSQA